MLFSIVIPVYNVEKYLLDCLNSIASQSFEDYEVILVDDGSTDNSGKICDDFCLTHNKFKAFHKENEGLLKTRLYGRSKMNGEYMISVDSDDFIDEETLAILKKYIEKYNYPDVICFNKYIYKNGKASKPNDAIEKEEVFMKNNRTTFLAELFLTYKYNNLVTKAIKSSLLHADDTDYSRFCANQGEDIAQTLYSAINANKIVVITDFLYFYRMNDNSITRLKLALKDIEKYNLRYLYELFLDYIDKLALPNYYRNKVIGDNITYVDRIYFRVLPNTQDKKEYNEVINYNWRSFLLYDGNINLKLLKNIKLIYKITIKAILQKNRIMIAIIGKLYKIVERKHKNGR